MLVQGRLEIEGKSSTYKITCARIGDVGVCERERDREGGCGEGRETVGGVGEGGRGRDRECERVRV